MNRSASHTQLTGDVYDELAPLVGVACWKNNTGTATIHGRPVKFSEPGAADVFAVYRGRFYGLECKTGAGRQSADQKKWQAKIERAGGVYVVVRSIQDARRALGVQDNHPKDYQQIKQRVFPR